VGRRHRARGESQWASDTANPTNLRSCYCVNNSSGWLYLRLYVPAAPRTFHPVRKKVLLTESPGRNAWPPGAPGGGANEQGDPEVVAKGNLAAGPLVAQEVW
jgi:hypothetical protein